MMKEMSKKKDGKSQMVRAEIVRRVMGLCERAKLSQSALAKSIGIERQTVYKWFTSNENVPSQAPSEGNLIDIARLFDTSVSYLYGETEDPRPANDWHSTEGITSSWVERARKAEDHLRQALELIAKINVAERFVHPAAVKEA